MKKFSLFVLSLLTLASCQQSIWNDIEAGFQSYDDYQSRCAFLLQQGRNVADIACLVADGSVSEVCDSVMPEGYSWEAVTASSLMSQAKVVDNKLVLANGNEYSLLVLPKQETMNLELLECIYKFEQQGLIVAGSIPEQFSEDMEAMTVPEGVSLETVLLNMGIMPDFFGGGYDNNLEFVHRTLGKDGDIFFLSNQNDKDLEIYPEFRVEDATSTQIWDPVTGEIHAWQEETLKLSALQSVFVVFSKD